jgi:4-hydroxybenzoate polyprenyltransferase
MGRNLLRLLRPKHYIKNALILTPLVFGNQLFNEDKFAAVFVALATFCFVASIVYIINDIRDIRKDQQHPIKKNRPLASGKISVRQAWLVVGVLAVLTIGVGLAGGLTLVSWLLLAGYLAINIGYSYGLKNVPIVDIALLVSGFVIRVLFGASVFDITVSHWLYMTILAGAFYVSLGKRRNEIITSGTKSRKVNELYSLQFLDKNMYVCMTLTLVFYSLWATDPAKMDTFLYLTIPLVILIFMTYSMAIEKNDSTGDPVDVILKHKPLLLLTAACGIIMFLALYL